MTVSFDKIPNNLRTPLFFVEIDNSMANSANEIQRTLLIGQMLPIGEAEPNTAIKVSSESSVMSLCGQGSMLHTMMDKYLKNDNFGEVWILPFADDESEMTQANGEIAVESAAVEAGVISLYIAGRRIRMSVKAVDTVEFIAQGLADRINADQILPVTATNEGAIVKLLSKHFGSCGNDIDIRLNYLGVAGDEVTPKGLKLNISDMSGGSGAPDLIEGLSNLQDREFDFIVNPYTDTSSLNTLKDFLSDDGGRWGWDQQIYGHSFSVLKGTYGQLSSAGEIRNNQHETIWGVNGSPNTSYDLAAAFVGALAPAIRNDPGRPTQTLSVSGVLPPVLKSLFINSERNNLLYCGISTFVVTDDNSIQLENTITTYQQNKFGSADDSYLQIETLYLLAYVNRYIKRGITSKYPRMKLAANGTRFGAGQAIVTPNIIRAEIIAQYKALEYNGYVQGSNVFSKNLIVEIDSDNPNRVNVLFPGTLINQLRVFAVRNQFRLRVKE